MKALDVAKYIINKCIELGKPISNLQLQKIMYFVHLDFLKKTGKKLITDEKFQAWQYGPVIESIYNKFRIYGGFTIDRRFEECNELNSEDDLLIDSSVKKYINLRPWELVQKSHNPDGAWAKVYEEGLKIPINDDLIAKEAGYV